MNKTFGFLFICIIVLAAGCNGSGSNPPSSNSGTPAPLPVLSYSIVATLPHDTSSFTEGLEFYNNTLLESAGNYSQSRLIQKEFPIGKIIKQVKLDDKYFGEGITVLHDTLYQLTYRESEVLVYNARDFKRIGSLPFQGEGWGMTNNGKELIVSNGSSNLYFYEPSTFKLLRTLEITANGSYIPNINELEYVNGYVYANVWLTGDILKIDPVSGKVVATMDFTDLVTRMQRDGVSEHFNGIAYNPVSKKIYITGKHWPSMFEIQFAY